MVPEPRRPPLPGQEASATVWPPCRKLRRAGVTWVRWQSLPTSRVARLRSTVPFARAAASCADTSARMALRLPAGHASRPAPPSTSRPRAGSGEPMATLCGAAYRPACASARMVSRACTCTRELAAAGTQPAACRRRLCRLPMAALLLGGRRPSRCNARRSAVNCAASGGGCSASNKACMCWAYAATRVDSRSKRFGAKAPPNPMRRSVATPVAPSAPHQQKHCIH
eukprot:2460063-Prymnesium_polylepis.2